MWNSKDIYYVSDSTGILSTNLGQSLLCQFPEIHFHEEQFPFIRSVKEARATLKYILKNSGGRSPIIFSTIMLPEVLKVFDTPEVELFDMYVAFLDRLERSLEVQPLRLPGFYRHTDNVSISKRVEAIHYTLEHDDGTKIDELDDADVILVGVSRSGKTPASVYLATQMGLKAANFPLTIEFLTQYSLPEAIKRNIKRTVGLTTSPEMLRKVREKRYAASNYAKLVTCLEELDQAKNIFLKNKIPVVNTEGKSIEETATQIMQEIGLSRKT